MDGDLKNMAKKAIPANKGKKPMISYFATFNYCTGMVRKDISDSESEVLVVRRTIVDEHGLEFLNGPKIEVFAQANPHNILTMYGITGVQAVRWFAGILQMRDLEAEEAEMDAEVIREIEANGEDEEVSLSEEEHWEMNNELLNK